MKRNRRLIYALVILGFITVAAVFGGANYLVNFALTPQNNKGRDIAGSYEYMFREYPYIKPWADSLRANHLLRDTTIVDHNGDRMHACYAFADSTTNRTAVIVHGYTDNAIRMFMIGYLYNHSLNYNILLPDLYGHGDSEGDHIQMGYKDRINVLRWMEIANEIFGGKTQMVVHGISMGAATTMEVSGEKQADYVKCFVEDCGYTSAWDEFANELKEMYGMPKFPLLYAASFVCDLKYGWSFKDSSPLKQVAKCHLPMLFIHGDNDTFVPTSMVYPLYEAKPEPKELWIVPGATHAMSYRDYPEKYTEKVKNFTDKYIK